MYTTDFQYLSSSKNTPIFLARYSPIIDSRTANSKKAVVFIPPIVEELNRSKRMYVLCARLLANIGIDAFCFDYAGTGDSGGEYELIEFEELCSNLVDVYEFVQNTGFQKISFVTLRFGALLTANTVSENNLVLDKCVFWDPIEKGEVFVRQQIRIKIAAAMSEGSKITTKSILADVSEQGYLEVGGYHLSASLIDSIKTLTLADAIDSLVEATEVHWMTLGAAKRENAPSPIPIGVSDRLRDNLTLHAIADTRFWIQQEVTISPKLLSATQAIFTSGM